MLMMIIPFIMILSLSFIITLMSIFMANKNKMNLEKMSPFECGFNPMSNSRLPFSMRFFLITIIFLIFDVEIALFMPMIYSFNISNIKMWMITSLMFLMILLVGLFHEWNYGAINWL